MAEDGHLVTLNVYDLSQGLAQQLSTMFLGKAIEAIWHTGVVVYGNEYFFGGGIQHCPAGKMPYGTPIRAVELGVTHLPQDVFESYLEEISPRYTAETYNLLTHNCNNFSNEVSQFLVGTSIPNYVLQLPNEVMSSPMGAVILPMIRRLEETLRVGAVPEGPQFRPTSFAQLTQARNTADKSSDSGANTSGNKDANGNEEAKEADDASPATLNNKAISARSTGVQDKSATAADPLGHARKKVQEEITREFSAIMATGTLRASEAATLATQRVMQRYSNKKVAVQQS